jgi:hypothetical protein
MEIVNVMLQYYSIVIPYLWNETLCLSPIAMKLKYLKVENIRSKQTYIGDANERESPTEAKKEESFCFSFPLESQIPKFRAQHFQHK